MSAVAVICVLAVALIFAIAYALVCRDRIKEHVCHDKNELAPDCCPNKNHERERDGHLHCDVEQQDEFCRDSASNSEVVDSSQTGFPGQVVRDEQHGEHLGKHGCSVKIHS